MLSSIYGHFVSFLLFLGQMGEPRPPHTAAGLQLSQWLTAFNTANETILLAYHQEHFPYSVANKDMSTIGRELSFSKGTGGFELHRILDSLSYELTVLLKGKHSSVRVLVSICVDETASHPVTKFRITTIAAPDDLIPELCEALKLDGEKRFSVVHNLTEALMENYISKASAKKISAALIDNLQNGKYDNLKDARDLVEILTDDLHAVGNDLHMHVLFGALPQNGTAPPKKEIWQHLRSINFGFGHIKRFRHDIFGLSIRGFVPSELPKVDGEIAKRMSAVANASALIIDLRENRGGSPHTVSRVLSYLFGEEKIHIIDIYDAKANTTEEFWTDPEVHGTKFGPTKPIYVLISNKTISGGEEMAYDLQGLGRATLVGETTAGAANPGSVVPLEKWYMAIIPRSYPKSPVTGTNWQGTGVGPDVRVKASDALGVAYGMAVRELGFKAEAPEETEIKWEDGEDVELDPSDVETPAARVNEGSQEL
jgi:retinol-binding protein 3